MFKARTDKLYSVKNLKEEQKRHTDEGVADIEKANPVFDIINNPYKLYFRQIPFLRMKRLLDSHRIDLNHESVLVAGCGYGMDIYLLRKYYKNISIFVSDISKKATQMTAMTFDNLNGMEADIESLPFKDNAFDYAFVSGSLHHLPRPIVGLYELLRVSSKGAIYIEPHDSWLTRLATGLGLAKKVEISGNYVYRFDKKEIRKICGSMFSKYDLMAFFALHKIAGNRFGFYILKALNKILNLFIAYLGNTLIFIIKK